MNPKCGNCPLGGEPGDCMGQAIHPRYCELVDPSNPDYRPAYVGIVRGEPAPAAIGPGPEARPSVAESLKALAAQKACPSYSVAQSCGCGTCAIGKGNNGKVSLQDCRRCLGLL